MSHQKFQALLAMKREQMVRFEDEAASIPAMSIEDGLAFARVSKKRGEAAMVFLRGLAGESVFSKCSATYSDGEFWIYSPDAATVERVRRMAGRIIDKAPKSWGVRCVKVRLVS